MTAVHLTCLVPAYNEGPRIGHVLEVAAATPGIDEIIVIDDGSQDDTVVVAERFAADHPTVRVLRQPQNGGKTRAVARGVAEARGSHLLLLDSDLLGLTPAALAALIAPVVSGRADVSISLRGNSPAPWRWIGLDYISGERVLPRALLADRLSALGDLPRFGLEVFMNRALVDARHTIAVVPWPTVSSPLKSRKQGVRAGLVSDLRMLRDIFQTVPPLGVLGQIFRMRQLRVEPVGPTDDLPIDPFTAEPEGSAGG